MGGRRVGNLLPDEVKGCEGAVKSKREESVQGADSWKITAKRRR